MNKYDYGYSLAEDSTNNWAFHRIKDNAAVLEVGPSNGNLIYHLTTQKNCIADIVEIDEDAGKQASRFARIACVGNEKGNLETSLWYQELQKNQYDYIVILDVLEHIRNPKEVLIQLASLLKKDGKILLSIPNIAHNSVIINLLQNKLEYTSVGLLDDTHVHFYTYQSVLQLLKDVGLTVEMSEVKQIAVNNNEIDAVYGVLPRDIDAYIKTRALGTAYQFLLTISKESQKTETIPELMYQPDVLYTTVVFDAVSGMVIAEKKVNPRERVEIAVPVNIDIKEIRIDPLDTNCIVSSLSLFGEDNNGRSFPLCIKEMTGNQFEGKFVFYDDDPQIYVDVPSGLKNILFSCDIDAFDSSVLELLIPSRDIFRQSNADYQQAKQLFERSEIAVRELTQSLHEAKEYSGNLLTELNNEKSNLLKTTGELLQLQNIKEQLHIENVLLQKENEQTQHMLQEQKQLVLQKQTQLKKQLQLKEQLQNEYKLLQEQTNLKLQQQEQLINELQQELNNVLNSLWGKLYNKLNHKPEKK